MCGAKGKSLEASRCRMVDAAWREHEIRYFAMRSQAALAKVEALARVVAASSIRADGDDDEQLE